MALLNKSYPIQLFSYRRALLSLFKIFSGLVTAVARVFLVELGCQASKASIPRSWCQPNLTRTFSHLIYDKILPNLPNQAMGWAQTLAREGGLEYKASERVKLGKG